MVIHLDHPVTGASRLSRPGFPLVYVDVALSMPCLIQEELHTRKHAVSVHRSHAWVGQGGAVK